MREAKTTDFENDKRRLVDYLNKTEAGNLELEKTVRTLQRRINLLEVSANDKDGFSSTSMDQEPTQQSAPSSQSQPKHSHHRSTRPLFTKANEDLIYGIHNQVSKFVLQKVALQIDQLVEQPVYQGINVKEDQATESRNYARIIPEQSFPDKPIYPNLLNTQAGIHNYTSSEPTNRATVFIPPTDQNHPGMQALEINQSYQFTASENSRQHPMLQSTRPPTSNISYETSSDSQAGTRAGNMWYPKPVENISQANYEQIPNCRANNGMNPSPRPASNEQNKSSKGGKERRRSYPARQATSYVIFQASGQPLYYNQPVTPSETSTSAQSFLWQAKPHRHKR